MQRRRERETRREGGDERWRQEGLPPAPGVSLSFCAVSGVFQPGIFSFSYERKSEEKMKTAGQIDGQVLFTAGQ